MKIAVIGAGSAGITTLYVIQKRKLAKYGDLVCFETDHDIGGTWMFNEESGRKVAEIVPVNGSAYIGLKMNSPRIIDTLHPDFPIPEEFDEFPTREQNLQYIRSFADKYDLRRYITFNSFVELIDWKNEKFEISVRDLVNNDKASTYHFDYVFMCGGQHRIPNIPIDDYKCFHGEILHYHDLRYPNRFHGKRIVVVGGSYGALDMVTILSKHVDKFYLSINKERTPFWFSEENLKFITEVKPRIDKATGNTVYFKDSSSVEADAIIYATGFRQFHPLSKQLELDFNYSVCLFPLFKHVVHPKFPNMFFIAKAYDFIIPAMRPHAELGCSIIDGSYQLPSQHDMIKDIKEFHKKWEPQVSIFRDYTISCPWLDFEQKLLDEICILAKCEPIHPKLVNLFYGLFRIMKQNCHDFRNLKVKHNWQQLELDDGMYE